MQQFLSFEDLKKLTPPIWLMLISIVMGTVVSGGLYLFFWDTSIYETMGVGKLIVTALVITLPVFVLNSIMAWCFLNEGSRISRLQTALTWGGVFTFLLFVILVMPVLLGLSYGAIFSPFCVGTCMELLMIVCFFVLSNEYHLIRKFWKWKLVHKILLLLNLVSIIFILQIVFGLIPLINTNLDFDRITLVNGFVVDMSIGIITSTFFYYLLVYIGERKRGKSIRSMLQWRLDAAAANMQVVIGYYIFKHGISCNDNKFLKVKPESFSNICNPSSDIIEYWYRWGNLETSSDVTGSTERGLVCHFVDLVKHHTEKIMESTIYSLEDTALMELVARIRMCELVVYTERLILNPKFKISQGGYDNTIIQFYQLYCELAEYVTLNDMFLKESSCSRGVAFQYQ